MSGVALDFPPQLVSSLNLIGARFYLFLAGPSVCRNNEPYDMKVARRARGS